MSSSTDQNTDLQNATIDSSTSKICKLPEIKAKPRDTRDADTRIIEAIISQEFAISFAKLNLETLPAQTTKLAPHLTMLEAGKNKFTEIPEPIFKLVNLIALGFSNNVIQSVSPQISKLQYLTHLYLTSNFLTFLPPEIGLLKHLCVLSVFENRLTFLPDEIGNCTNLKQILISSNRIKKLPDSICKCVHLESISLNNNPLEEIPNQIGNLTGLTTLFAHNCHLRTIPPSIGKLKALTLLDLTNNKLESLPLDAISELTQLKGYIFGIPAFSLDKNPRLPSPPLQIQVNGAPNVAAYFNNLKIQNLQSMLHKRLPSVPPPDPTSPISSPTPGSPRVMSPTTSFIRKPKSPSTPNFGLMGMDDIQALKDAGAPLLPQVVACRFAKFGCPWIGEPVKEPIHIHKECHFAKVRGLLDYIEKMETRLQRAFITIQRQQEQLMAYHRSAGDQIPGPHDDVAPNRRHSEDFPRRVPHNSRHSGLPSHHAAPGAQGMRRPPHISAPPRSKSPQKQQQLGFMPLRRRSPSPMRAPSHPFMGSRIIPQLGDYDDDDDDFINLV